MMSDLISRQAVLDKFQALCDACGEGEKYDGVMCRCCSLDDGICIVEDMPSAEPEQTAKVIKHKYWLGVSLNVVGEQTIGYEWLCGNCKKKVIGGDEYCSHCGTRLEWK